MMMLERNMLSCCFMYSSVDEESVDECDRYQRTVNVENHS